MNSVVLTARLVERGALRYTPAGLPALNLSLKHESQMSEAGQIRRVAVELRAVAIGLLTQRLMQLELGAECTVAGFVSAQRNGRGVVLHITELD